MGRWEPDSRGRLQEAALALYSERGFDQTTAAQIAARAGLTERTFFRHFADKREVLFGGSALLQERIVAGVAGAPPGTGPSTPSPGASAPPPTMLGEFRRDLSRQRQAVIAANPELARAGAGEAGRLRRRRGRGPAPPGRGRAAGQPGRRGGHDGVARRPRAVGERGRRPGPRRRHAGRPWPSSGPWPAAADRHRRRSGNLSGDRWTGQCGHCRIVGTQSEVTIPLTLAGSPTGADDASTGRAKHLTTQPSMTRCRTNQETRVP